MFEITTIVWRTGAKWLGPELHAADVDELAALACSEACAGQFFVRGPGGPIYPESLYRLIGVTGC